MEKIDKKTLRDEVYSRLFSSIVAGNLLPGQTLTLRDLSRQLGVSMMPIREALWQLASEKIIVIDPNREIRVNSLSQSELKETIQLQYNLDVKLLGRACIRRPDSAVAEVQSILVSMETAIKSEDIHTYLFKNTEFHFSIYSHAGLPIAFECVKHVWSRVAPYFHLASTKRGIKPYELDHHKKVFQGFDEKNRSMAKAALRESIKNWASIIEEFAIFEQIAE